MTCEILKQITSIIIDMDGVLWRDEQAIGNLPAIFEHITIHGWRLTLATNNATRSASQYVDKLKSFGVRLSVSQIINSSQATAAYLRRIYPAGTNVFVVGESGLLNDLASAGFPHSNQEVRAVVAGMDRSLDYHKLKTAAHWIYSGAAFIGTNPDRTYPTPEGPAPGAGSILAALEAATGVTPIIIGKPNPEMYLQAMEWMDASPSETLVIGDRLETDILGAQRLGCRTCVVLSGVSSMDEIYNWRPSPDCIENDLSSLFGID